jgi:hypothetical protein
MLISLYSIADYQSTLLHPLFNLAAYRPTPLLSLSTRAAYHYHSTHFFSPYHLAEYRSTLVISFPPQASFISIHTASSTDTPPPPRPSLYYMLALLAYVRAVSGFRFPDKHPPPEPVVIKEFHPKKDLRRCCAVAKYCKLDALDQVIDTFLQLLF